MVFKDSTDYFKSLHAQNERRNLYASDETVIFQSHDCACQIIIKNWPFLALIQVSHNYSFIEISDEKIRNRPDSLNLNCPVYS